MKRMGICFLLVTSLFINGCSNSTDIVSDLTLGSSLNTGAGIAADTLIMQLDSTEKRVSDFMDDEYVLSNNGIGKQIVSVITGIGRYLLLIKTSTGKSLLVGGDQPIKTTFGWIPVNELQVGALVYCINGLEMIVQINVQSYNSKIYNLAFDKEIGIYGNGIVIGDYTMMQRIRNEQEIYIDR